MWHKSPSKIVAFEYDHKDFIKLVDFSDLFLPQNQEMLTSFSLVEMLEIKGGRQIFSSESKKLFEAEESEFGC